jgi:hypothetical protein
MTNLSKKMVVSLVCLLGGMGCNHSYGGWYSSTGAQCGNAAPGCDYYADGKTKLSIQEDPSFQSDNGTNDGAGRGGFVYYYSDTFSQNVEQSPDGLIFSMTTQTALNSMNTPTKDVDLMRADLQTADLTSRAQLVAAKFQMNIEAATQLTMLADKFQELTAAGSMQLSQEDGQAITRQAFAIAGLNANDVNIAIAKSLAGDDDAEEDLLNMAATGLGMQAQMLKSQLLPALGIQP